MRDRIVHQIIYDYLLALFEGEFISDSYSSRLNKGQYKAIDTFKYFLKLAEDNKNPPWVLKCDVRKYFNNIHSYFGILKHCHSFKLKKKVFSLVRLNDI